MTCQSLEDLYVRPKMRDRRSIPRCRVCDDELLSYQARVSRDPGDQIDVMGLRRLENS